MKKPNQAAQALGKLRWKGSTKAERSATAERLTEARQAIPEEVRRATAKKAAKARWAKRKKKVVS